MVVLKQQLKRNSINDLFYFDSDFVDETFVPVTERFPGVFVGVVSHEIEEAITWQEVYDNWDNLRADLKDLFPKSVIQQKIDNDSGLCYFNPFSLTRTVVYTFNDMESFIDSYKNLQNSEFNDIFLNAANLANEYENTLTETLFVDGVETPFPAEVTSAFN